MDGKTRILRAIDHKFSDRFPMDLWADEIVVQSLEKHFQVTGIGDVRKKLDTDFCYVSPVSLFPTPVPDAQGIFTDEWGVVKKRCANRYGYYDDVIQNPLAEAETRGEVDAYPWPSPENWDYSVLKSQCEAGKGKALIGGNGHFFCPGADLRGYENWLIDIIEESDVGLAIMEHMADYWEVFIRRVVEETKGYLDVLYLADDYSSQRGLMISPQSWRNFFRPYLKRLIEIGKQNGLKIFFHSCGAVRQLIPDLIEIGVDILNPIQIRAEGMEPGSLAKEYGKDICFHGGVDLQKTLPMGSVKDVEDEVKRLMETLGKYGGYIVAPGHTIQPDTPLENILAIYRTVQSGGK